MRLRGYVDGRARQESRRHAARPSGPWPWHNLAQPCGALLGSGQLCHFSWASRPVAARSLPMRRSYDGRQGHVPRLRVSERQAMAVQAPRRRRTGSESVLADASSVLAPPHAAGGALVEGGHRLVGRADLQLLVVRAVVAALAAVGCREWGRDRLRELGRARWRWQEVVVAGSARAPSV